MANENYRIWAVGQLVLAVADSISARFNPLQVEGEISSWTTASSGHCYFTLKDENGQLRCAMFKRHANALVRPPREGDRVCVRGRLDIYPSRGELQMVVESLTAVGQGAWYERFVQLKSKLQAQGLFDDTRKKKLPVYPGHVAVISSLEAAALQDVCVTLQRRATHLHITVIPSLVQGPQAPAQLIDALQAAQLLHTDASGWVDVILLVRGGGSIEDLWAFNDETLAQAIAASKIPVISGVGHESDFTIADFVADLRAPTPTAAAEMCCPSSDQIHMRLDSHERDMHRSLQRCSQLMRHAIEHLQTKLAQPNRHWMRRQQQLDEFQTRLSQALKGGLQQRAWVLQGHASHLQSLNPQRVLERGYAWVTSAQGHLITRSVHLKPHDQVSVKFSDGIQSMTVNTNGS